MTFFLSRFFCSLKPSHEILPVKITSTAQFTFQSRKKFAFPLGKYKDITKRHHETISTTSTNNFSTVRNAKSAAKRVERKFILIVTNFVFSVKLKIKFFSLLFGEVISFSRVNLNDKRMNLSWKLGNYHKFLSF